MKKPLLLTYLILVFLAFSCGQNSKKETLTIPEGKVGLIGYASLTTKERMEMQLGKAYDGPIRVIHLDGYKRFWNAIFPNDLDHVPMNLIISCVVDNDTIVPAAMIALNIEEREGVAMNCCLFFIDEADLSVMDASEKGYERIDVTDAIREFEVSHGKIYAYQVLPEYKASPQADQPRLNAVPRVYLESIFAGFTNLGEAYQKEFEATTESYPPSLELECHIVEQ